MTEFFPDVEPIEFAGPDATDELVFRRYDRERVVSGKPMSEHLRFASAYWHTMRNPLSDPFGTGTAQMPWDDGSDSVQNACTRARAVPTRWRTPRKASGGGQRSECFDPERARELTRSQPGGVHRARQKLVNSPPPSASGKEGRPRKAVCTRARAVPTVRCTLREAND